LYGVPDYLKIDIEGADLIVLRDLLTSKFLPSLISVEDCRFGYDYINLLSQMGYKKFKLLDQSEVPNCEGFPNDFKFTLGSSGPFGDHIPGNWLEKNAFEKLYEITVRTREGLRIKAHSHWFDIHASL
jgi:hypothetical protein